MTSPTETPRTQSPLPTPTSTPTTTAALTTTPSSSEILTKVVSLADPFSTCVEAFNLIHPSKDLDRSQKVALARLGLQQGRLLIFGDAVGISSPPASIATHMIPSRAGPTNPDPHLPINFMPRHSRLDEKDVQDRIREALNAITGRPATMTREELMEVYGLKPPKSLAILGYPALDTNRLEGFREKYALLHDLAREMGVGSNGNRGRSMTIQRWTVKDVEKFGAFVEMVKGEVDSLIELMGVKEQVDRGMKTDIRALGWHPDLTGPSVWLDCEKLKLIREACAKDYPEYVAVADVALQYLSAELKAISTNAQSAADKHSANRRKSEEGTNGSGKSKPEKEKDKRRGFFGLFRSKTKDDKKKKGDAHLQTRADSPAAEEKPQPQELSRENEGQDTPRALSVDSTASTPDALSPSRSKSLSALPDSPTALDIATRLEKVNTIDSKASTAIDDSLEPVITNHLVHADTAHSLISRHDMYKGVGRVETNDIRAVAKAHELA